MKALFACAALVLLVHPAVSAAEDKPQSPPVEVRDHVYPQALAPVEMLVRRGRVHQKAGRNHPALRLYFQAIEKLAEFKTDNPYLQKAAKDLTTDIQTYINQIKDIVQKQGMILYRGKFYTFDALQKVLKKEAERRRRYEMYLRREQQERRERQQNYWQQEQRRQYEERRLKEDFRFQQEQRRQNEERRRNYEMQMRQQGREESQ